MISAMKPSSAPTAMGKPFPQMRPSRNRQTATPHQPINTAAGPGLARRSRPWRCIRKIRATVWRVKTPISRENAQGSALGATNHDRKARTNTGR